MGQHRPKYAGVEQALADEISNIGTDYENLGRIEGLSIALAGPQRRRPGARDGARGEGARPDGEITSSRRPRLLAPSMVRPGASPAFATAPRQKRRGEREKEMAMTNEQKWAAVYLAVMFAGIVVTMVLGFAGVIQ